MEQGRIPVRTLAKRFYQNPTPAVARGLLGALLCRRTPDGLRVGRIVETEAYLGADDAASHAARGVTPRNRPMFEPPGHAYVYFTYGMHWCFNVVAWDAPPGAVLIRAVEPLAGVALMTAARGVATLAGLTNGPAKLCRAFSIDAGQNGASLIDGKGGLFIARPDTSGPSRPIATTPRIGIRKATELALRFCYADSAFLSRPAGRAC
ncbi:MAG: DNA-3-methyladenine glycosylase [Proteobacteria bacterium]|nr:DNA-3-methyladenine glycosylase [Pseudomonadota bacterium]